MKGLVDNFELLGRYLFEKREPLTEDQFYFLQILVREGKMVIMLVVITRTDLLNTM